MKPVQFFLRFSPKRALTSDIELLKPTFNMAVSVAKEEMDYTIKPEAGASNISTEEWPLLLKNYDKRT